jgi:undecaprenyl-diphosphatase
MPGETAPEASFPSSHTMLIMTVMIAVMIVSDKYFGNLFGAFVRVLCFLTTLITVGGRLWCGVHWLTAIIGGILLSATLLFLFSAAVSGRRVKESDPGLEFAYDNKTAYKSEGSSSTRGYKPKH